MPKSKKRKKKGKPVGNGEAKNYQQIRGSDRVTGVSLQDLINVVAYQEYVKDGSIVAPNAEIHIPDEIPVVTGEGENKRQIGVTNPVPGDPDAVSVHLTDPDVIRYIHDDNEFSIDEEQD